MLKELESYYSTQIEEMPADIGELIWPIIKSKAILYQFLLIVWMNMEMEEWMEKYYFKFSLFFGLKMLRIANLSIFSFDINLLIPVIKMISPPI